VRECRSLLATVSQSGTISELRLYDPYGGPRPGSAALAGIGFTGEWQNETGLLNLRFRQYGAALGRFIGRDSVAGFLALPQTGNRYIFGGANPLLAADPSGHFNNHIINPAVDFLNSPETLSLALQLIPLIGDGYSIAAGFAGYDWIAGRALSEDERPLYIAAGLAPFALGGMVIAGKGLAKLAPRTMDAAGEAWQAYRGSRFASEAGGFNLGSIASRFERPTSVADDAVRMGRKGERGTVTALTNVGASRTVAVGETMSRIEPAAQAAGIAAYRGRPDRWYDRLLPDATVERLRHRHNATWLTNEMDRGSIAIDYGIDPHRASRGSAYAMESEMLESYPLRYDASVWPWDRP
jgi:RHS repeat-associated protein